MNETKRLTLIEFNNGKKVTFDESMFTVTTSEKWITVKRDTDDGVIFETNWDKVLYVRTGVFEKKKPQRKNKSENAE
jgi:hypothetical protein